MRDSFKTRSRWRWAASSYEIYSLPRSRAAILAACRSR